MRKQLFSVTDSNCKYALYNIKNNILSSYYNHRTVIALLTKSISTTPSQINRKQALNQIILSKLDNDTTIKVDSNGNINEELLSKFDWAQLTANDIHACLSENQNDTQTATVTRKQINEFILSIYPQLTNLSTITKRPYGYWNDLKNQKAALNSIILDKLETNNNNMLVDSKGNINDNILSNFDWKSITKADFIKLNLMPLLSNNYHSKINTFILTIYPQVANYDSFKQRRRTKGHWNNLSNQRDIINEIIASKLNTTIDKIVSPTLSNDNLVTIRNDILASFDWTTISMNDFKQLNAMSLIKHVYNGSLHNFLVFHYPQATTNDTFTNRKHPQYYWDDIQNHKQVLDRIILSKVNINNNDNSTESVITNNVVTDNIIDKFDWNLITKQDFIDLNARTLLVTKYNNSIEQCIKAIYPQADTSNLSKKYTHGQWDDINDQRNVLESIITSKIIELSNIDSSSLKLEYNDDGSISDNTLIEFDWSVITIDDFTDIAPSLVPYIYGGSINKLITTVYANASNFKYLYKRGKSSNYWQDEHNIKQALNQVILSKLNNNERDNVLSKCSKDNIVIDDNILTKFDWSSITVADFKQINALTAVIHHKTVNKLILSVYPNAIDNPNFKDKKRPNAFWDDLTNHKITLNSIIANKLNKSLAVDNNSNINNKLIDNFDWSLLTREDFANVNALQLLNIYDNSINNIILTSYPRAAKSDKFKQRIGSRGYWNDISLQKESLNKVIANKLQSNSPLKIDKDGNIDDSILCNFNWQSLTGADFQQANAFYILRMYKSISNYVSAVYPQVKQYPSFLARTRTKGYWQSTENVKNFIRKVVAKHFNIVNQDDWYRISLNQLVEVGGGGMRKYHSNLYQMLTVAYPSVEWDESRFLLKNKRSRQFWLLVKLRELFQNDTNIADNNLQIIEEYLHEELTRQSNTNIEFDIFIPQLNLAFEYQGEHHFIENPAFASLELQTTRDREKQVLCDESGIDLVSIPYWWDNKIESLIATIKAKCPSIVTRTDYLSDAQINTFETVDITKEIPSEPPKHAGATSLQNKNKSVVMLCSTWANSNYFTSHNSSSNKSDSINILSKENTIDPTGYIITEKYDGVRVYIKNGQVFSRSKNTINIPNGWNDALLQYSKQNPKISFDCELWIGYNSLNKVNRLLRQKKVVLDDWDTAKLMIFDIVPTTEQQKAMTVEERLELLQQSITAIPSDNNSRFEIVTSTTCRDRAHLLEELKKVTAKGGEGLVIKKPKSVYEFARSSNMLKVKDILDSEVKLVRKAPNCIGFECELPNGKVQVVRCKWTDYKSPPADGSILTVQHYGMNHTNKLKYPFYLRTRTDVDWEQLVASA